MTLTKKDELLYAIASFSQAMSCASWAMDIEKDIAEHLWGYFPYQLNEKTIFSPEYTLDDLKEYLSEINSLADELQEYPWIDSSEQHELDSFKPLKDVILLAKERFTLNHIKTINSQIEVFEDSEKKNFCEECLKKKGVLTEYSPSLTDTGVCDLCGKTDDLVNVRIAELVLKNNLNPEDYHQKGGTRIYPKDIFRNEIKRSGMSFYLTNSPIVMYGGAGKSKSYSPFFVKYNLMGMTNEQLKVQLEEIIHNIDLPEEDKNRAKNILDNIIN
jgi:hypothetical protein